MSSDNIVEIVEYAPNEYVGEFARINRQWIEKLFKMEAADIAALENPQKIIDNGGYIIYAKRNNSIVGTAALVFYDEGVLEIAKMGVDENCRGCGIGDKLMAHLINYAKQKGNIHTLKIETSSLLPNAIHLYRKHGFVDDAVSQSTHGYERADVFLTLPLR